MDNELYQFTQGAATYIDLDSRSLLTNPSAIQHFIWSVYDDTYGIDYFPVILRDSEVINGHPP